MSSYAARYDIPCMTTGDTWLGMQMVWNQDITDWQFRMNVVGTNATSPALRFTSEGDDPNITITDGPGGEVVWAQTKISLAHGVYKFDIEVTKPGGIVRTYITGQWAINDDITK
jgi:hypothetical protein